MEREKKEFCKMVESNGSVYGVLANADGRIAREVV